MSKRFRVSIMILMVGFLLSLFTSSLVPEFISLCIPTAFALGPIYLLSREKKDHNTQKSLDSNPQLIDLDTRIQKEDARSPQEHDPFWGPFLEYTYVIQETIISEGQKNMLDNEIVDKVLSLLSRITRLIPQLKELNDSGVNHNIQRLVFKDLNGAINPFLKLSGEGKRLNRRLLLDGIKDINSKLSIYVETIEQKDLIELQTRMDLIQQRYRSTD
ncbi:hypothetical protein J2Z69_001868 [Paenibacillus shirakamiensis]|uniref:Uncharacterized protein n=1 Tax=Paenibacillus shirakamiensis TaxID=1265935 RepID=A0ABS4JGK3_9BACL|nr:hypothetical protein [Paenibacillus shirakamiensis]MBP2000837.1 hypothetical protein [Paenibacillus shirakamiensis]